MAIHDSHCRGVKWTSLAPRDNERAHGVAETSEEAHVIHAIAGRDERAPAARIRGVREEVMCSGASLIPGVGEVDGHRAAEDRELVIHSCDDNKTRLPSQAVGSTAHL